MLTCIVNSETDLQPNINSKFQNKHLDANMHSKFETDLQPNINSKFQNKHLDANMHSKFRDRPPA